MDETTSVEMEYYVCKLFRNLHYVSLCNTGLAVFLFARPGAGMERDTQVVWCSMNTTIRPLSVFVKALILFLLINLLYGVFEPSVAEISVYNSILPGLKRMPFGVSTDPYTVTVDNVDAMFAAHEISAQKKPDEIRVALIGDSSIWGESLSNEDTLAGQWNKQGLRCGDKTIRFYNLGYPHPSIIKDLIFIDETRDRQPDAIIWFVTLNTLMNQFRLHPFVIENREQSLQIMDAYDIPFAPRRALEEAGNGFYDRTLVGQRTLLARWLKLQTLGLIRSATGDDVVVPPGHLETLAHDVRKNPNYRELEPGADLRLSLLLNALTAGYDLAGATPLLLVNEPIFVANGHNSDIRYNDLYPRWAYDQYRELVAAQVTSWNYLDLWNAIPPEYFTDTPMHVNASGERLLAGQITPALMKIVCK